MAAIVGAMDRNGLRSIAGRLLFGDADSADGLAHELVARNDPQMWALLVGTIHSDDDMPARIRCLEVLAKAASLGNHETASAILAALGQVEPDQSPAPLADTVNV